MIHLAFYVPVDYAERVKEALFSVGAGRIGDYEYCSFESEGWGQFRPLKGSNAFIGEVGKLEKVREIKVEMVLEDHLADKVIQELKKSHPYETPAYYMIKTVRQKKS